MNKTADMPAAERTSRRIRLLEEAGWQTARAEPLAGDASYRTYQRLHRNGGTAVLMDAPPPREDVRPFIAMAAWLRQGGYSAPEIMAADEDAGFLLLEDLGDALFTTAIAGGADETELYEASVNLLVDLQSRPPPPDVPPYSTEFLSSEADLLTAWFLPHAGIEASAGDVAAYGELWRGVLAHLAGQQSVLVLRDFMADNLLWLPERRGLARVGLLDFQGALMGSPAYDLMSLLRDVRRDVSGDLADSMIDRYLSAKGLPDTEARRFREDFAILGVQRNAKIAGIFSRLLARDGKSSHLAYLPRVWRMLERDLDHPALADLRDWFDRVIPRDKRS